MTSNESKLLDALAFAANRHRAQRRKNVDASPYINHPIEVAALLAGPGGVTDIEILMAAILHDTVEDTETSFDELENVFGSQVRDLVGEVTDDKSLPKQRRKELQVESAPHKSDRAKQLKIADKVCNIRDIDSDNPAGWDLERKREYLRWGQSVVGPCKGINPALDQLFDEVVHQVIARLNEGQSNRR
jgi:guanosine-3',5'-bis(diphosphate) 3'-pyrophosphohydrolase